MERLYGYRIEEPKENAKVFSAKKKFAGKMICENEFDNPDIAIVLLNQYSEDGIDFISSHGVVLNNSGQDFSKDIIENVAKLAIGEKAQTLIFAISFTAKVPEKIEDDFAEDFQKIIKKVKTNSYTV